MTKLLALVTIICLIGITEIKTVETPSHLNKLPVNLFPKGTFDIVSLSEPTLSSLKTKLTFQRNQLFFRECNNYRCSVNIRGQNISIKSCFGTRMFCPNSKEFDLVKFLNRVKTWSKEGNVYKLVNKKDGKIISLKLRSLKK